MTKRAPPLSAFLQEYLPRDRGASRHTIGSYTTSFRLLATFASDRYGIQNCSQSMQAGATQLNITICLSFFRFLEFRYPDHLELAARVHAIPQKKGDVPALEYVDRDEVVALLNAPDTATKSGTRDRAILCLACNAGLRVSELVGLGLDDVRMPQLDEVRVMDRGRFTGVKDALMAMLSNV